MKIFRNIILHLSAVAALVFAASCEDLAMGDNFLRKPPSNDVTIDTVFSTKEYAVLQATSVWSLFRLEQLDRNVGGESGESYGFVAVVCRIWRSGIYLLQRTL